MQIPKQFLLGEGMRLIRTFEPDEPDDAVPVDQIVID